MLISIIIYFLMDWKQTWVEKYNCLQTSIFVVIDLNFLKGSDQLIQNSVGHTADLNFTTVAVNDVAVS